MTTPQVSIRELCVDYITDAGDVRAVNKVSFDIGKGEIFGLAGESGCGKSTVAFSLMRLHKPPAFITGGEVLFDGHGDLLKKPMLKCRHSGGARCPWCSKVP
ncbi:(GlcNAc)2 ABC transporter ATP-binding component 1 [Photobacterium aphoticum]|uniref:(GlcNAc)2 ABC transporter ATP-binding component 1 n=1 Tax=Photobacterium aphoticum TaxID=754436 RepID=A0A090QQU9_9GAMM|nr:(GlcNAc)2 ABC transporter ATP-binding component 1 [Photobacterium aphoticum]